MDLGTPASEKALAAERSISWVRFAVILFNSAAFVIFAPPAGTQPRLAWALIAASLFYAAWVLLREPYKRLPRISLSWLFTAMDGILIAVWVYATGAYDSPFYVLWFGGLVSIAYRFRLRETLAMGAFYAGTYLAVLWMAGELAVAPLDVTVRLAYIGFVAWIGGLVGEEVFEQTQAKIDLRHLSEASQGVAEAWGLDDALERVIDAAVELVAADAGAVFLIGEDETVEAVHARGLGSEYLETVQRHAFQMPVAEPLLSGQDRVHIEDVQARDLPKGVDRVALDEDLGTVAYFAMRDEGELLGALGVYRREVNPFSPVELELMEALAGHAVLAVGNAELIEDLVGSEGRWRSLVENIPSFVVLVDEQGRIEYLNQAGYGMSEEEVLGREIEAFLAGGESEGRLRETLDEVLRTGTTRELEVKATDPEAWFRVQVAPLPEASGPEAAIIVASDITEHRQLVKDLVRSNEDLQQYAYAASHDLKEPLRMVQSYVQLLERSLDERLSEDEEAFIGYAVEGTQRMNELIDGLLRYARVDQDARPFEPVDLDTLLEGTLQDLAPVIQEADAKITSDRLPVVNGDRVQLAQLFHNVLSNAIKFRDGSAPHVHVSAEADEHAWRIQVRDDGIGIDPAYHDQMFTLYKRLHDRERYPGSGIGLAVCKRIVERHGGSIGVDSQRGEGTTVWFTLPSRDADEPRE